MSDLVVTTTDISKIDKGKNFCTSIETLINDKLYVYNMILDVYINGIDEYESEYKSKPINITVNDSNIEVIVTNIRYLTKFKGMIYNFEEDFKKRIAKIQNRYNVSEDILINIFESYFHSALIDEYCLNEMYSDSIYEYDSPFTIFNKIKCVFVNDPNLLFMKMGYNYNLITFNKNKNLLRNILLPDEEFCIHPINYNIYYLTNQTVKMYNEDGKYISEVNLEKQCHQIKIVIQDSEDKSKFIDLEKLSEDKDISISNSKIYVLLFDRLGCKYLYDENIVKIDNLKYLQVN